MELAEKISRFGRIAEEADAFQLRIWKRLQPRLMVRLLVSYLAGKGAFARRIWRHLKFRYDLFDLDTPPEILELVREEMSPEEAASEYGKVTAARYSLPELAKYANRELALDLEDLEAIETVIEARKSSLADSSSKAFLVFALALLSWFCSDIPDAMFPHWGIDQAKFTIAFYLGCGLVGLALYVLGVQWYFNGRAEKQARLGGRLLAYCRAELKAGPDA